MKVKLLKKLRKKAYGYYRIVFNYGVYFLEQMDSEDNEVWSTYTYSRSLDDIKPICDELRELKFMELAKNYIITHKFKFKIVY